MSSLSASAFDERGHVGVDWPYVVGDEPGACARAGGRDLNLDLRRVYDVVADQQLNIIAGLNRVRPALKDAIDVPCGSNAGGGRNVGVHPVLLVRWRVLWRGRCQQRNAVGARRRGAE